MSRKFLKKKTVEELIVLTCKEHSCFWQLLQVYLYIAASSFMQLFYIVSLSIYLLQAECKNLFQHSLYFFKGHEVSFSNNDWILL